MAVAVTVTPASSAIGANEIRVTGLAALQVVILYRQTDTKVERIPGTVTADSAGIAVWSDYLYPYDLPVTYVVYNADGSTVLATSTPTQAVPSGGNPWVKDAVFPGQRYAALTIVDVLDLTHPGRVSTFPVAAQKYPINIGDIRLGPTGSLQLLCKSHMERDTVIYALSSGNPVVLRIPAGCQDVVDERTFTPVDIRESRLSTHGAVLLAVDFVDAEISEIGSFVPVTYAAQTSNAFAAGLTYGSLGPPATGLSANFYNKTYKDMYVSQTGIRP